MKELQNKTILFISPRFFGYEQEIKNELELLGAKVIYFDDRPDNKFFTKLLIRLNFKILISHKINNYYKNIITLMQKEKIDYLFLNTPETFPIKVLKLIKGKYPDILVYTYFWDSVYNRKNALKYLDVSDKYFTFDENDSCLDSRIRFLPLFYISAYEEIAKYNCDKLYDIAFIGTVHSDRYRILKQIKDIAQKNNLKYFIYLYSPSKLLFFLQKVFLKDFRRIPLNDISFVPLEKEEVLNIIKKTRSVIDIEHKRQTGLTIRTIEVFGAKRKLITTNKNIKKYDIYNSNNICVIDKNKLEINIDFFNNVFTDINQRIYEKYRIKNWLKTIFFN